MRASIQRWSLILAFAFLISHELDAVFNLEWRVLPITSFLPDNVGRITFVLAHVPLLALLVYALWVASETTRRRAGIVFALFCLAHAGLHWLYSDHPEYRFDSWDANLLIIGAGLFGALHLAAQSRFGKVTPSQ